MPKFAKAMAMEPDSLRVMLAAIDRHLKQNDSKISIAKNREFVKHRQVKQELFEKLGHGKLKHLPSKMKSSYGKIEIDSFMKNMALESELDVEGRKLTNHSLRKTLVKKLKASNQPRTEEVLSSV